ncbi:MAG: hypothetical protein KUF80_14580 [Candidatus Thiodiazotropha sp. (ex Codakia orbicularis)]|nr:hypothetical protein [Candidatus Thiodiazotropha sp. (ex Codakia orbicularis)]
MSHEGRNAISLGDLAIAVKRLPTRDMAHLAKIAGCLGFGLEAVEPPKSHKGARGKEQSPEQEALKEPSPAKPQVKPAPKKPRIQVSLPKPPPPVDGYVSQLKPLPRNEVTLPIKIDQAAPLKLDVDAAMQSNREPVFGKREERAILSTAVAVQTAAGHVDLERVIDRLIEQKLVDRLPRRPLPTLKYGVQLLLDRSESMLPYAQDLETLETNLKKLTGSSRFSSGSFKGTPLATPRYGKLRNPLKITRNVPILLVTDFGISAPLLSRDRVGPGGWLTFAKLAEKKNCPVVALIPHKPRYWPDLARANYLCIHWDRATNAGDLRKVVGIGHRLEGCR